MALSEKQRTFVAEYLVDLNATQAAIRAGYSPKTAQKNAARLMANEGIAAAVQKGQAERLGRVEITAQRVLDEIGVIAFADTRDLYDDQGRLKPVKEWPEAVARAVAGLETTKRNLVAGDGEQEDVVKLKRWDKLKALEMLAKHHALLTEKHEHVVSGALLEALQAGRERVAKGKQ